MCRSSTTALCLSLLLASHSTLANDCHPAPDCSQARINRLGEVMRYALAEDKPTVASSILQQIAACAWYRRQAQSQPPGR